VRRRGRRLTGAGPQVRYDCTGPDGTQHFFTLLDTERRASAPPTERMRCPEPGHADGRTQRRDTRVTKTGRWKRYRCIRPNGDTHHFSVLEAPSGAALTSLTKPPACAEHGGSRVTRHGTFGKGESKRQRYWCVPSAPNSPHSFTPPLTRQAVAVGVESCSTCDELLSPHRGALNGARHQTLPLPVIALALAELAAGESYAQVSVRMRDRRDTAAGHLRDAHGLTGGVFTSTPTGTTSAASDGQNAWQLAANLVEQYSPLITGPMFESLRAREARQRAANDAALAADPHAGLLAPVTWVLDEQPVWVEGRRHARHQRATWSLLIVVETRYRASPHPGDLPLRESRLRLVRAYPMATRQAWELVFDELGTRPDFIVADRGTAIAHAVERVFGSEVGIIPSLFHLFRALRVGLLKQPPAVTRLEGRDVLVPELAKHLDRLDREALGALAPGDWSQWWDELLDKAVGLGVPTAGLREQRSLYEPTLLAAIPMLLRQPQLPASNAAVENRIRTRLEPFLAARGPLYRNLARTNFLLDLAVARDQGALNDLEALAQRIRADNEGAGGWAPAPRLLTDRQPVAGPGGKRVPYSSLLNPHLVGKLHQQRLGASAPDDEPEGPEPGALSAGDGAGGAL
jgi:hypothetical protein